MTFVSKTGEGCNVRGATFECSRSGLDKKNSSTEAVVVNCTETARGLDLDPNKWVQIILWQVKFKLLKKPGMTCIRCLDRYMDSLDRYGPNAGTYVTLVGMAKLGEGPVTMLYDQHPAYKRENPFIGYLKTCSIHQYPQAKKSWPFSLMVWSST